MVDLQAPAIPRDDARSSPSLTLALPPANAADVWTVRLEDFHDPAGAAALRSEEWAIMAGDPARARARIALRQLLARYSGLPAAAIVLTCGPYGKPEMRDFPLSFSVARRGDSALIAIAARGRVGVDLERHRPLPELHSISALLHPEEHALLARMPDPARTSAFYRIWTRKEAALKALGTGIAAGLDGFSVLPRRISDPRPDTAGAACTSPLLLHDLRLGPGWSGALATETAVTGVRLRALSPADAQGGGS